MNEPTFPDYTIAEVAWVLNISTGAVLMRIRRGKLAAYKRGRQWFISNEEVLRVVMPKETTT